MNTARWLLPSLLLLTLSEPGRAQDRGAVGVAALAPSAIGMTWHLSDRLALRPEVTFSTSSLADQDDTRESSGSSVSPALSALIGVRRWGDVTAYVSPRIGYARTSSVSEVLGARLERTTSTWTAGGAFGAQVLLGDRVALFGESGVIFSRQGRSDSGPFTLDTPAIRTFGSRSSVGVVFYLTR